MIPKKKLENLNISIDLIDFFMNKGYLLSPEIFENNAIDENFLNLLERNTSLNSKPLVISEDIFTGVLKNRVKGVDWTEFDKSRVFFEKGNDKPYSIFRMILCGEEQLKKNHIDSEKFKEKNEQTKNEIDLKNVSKFRECETEIGNVCENVCEGGLVVKNEINTNVKILKSYNQIPKKWVVKDFVNYFKTRYNFLQGVLQNRQELQNIISINRIKNKENKSKVSCIGLVFDKRITKNGNTILTLEDPTGTVNVLLKKDVEGVGDVCFDEVVAITGTLSKGMVFVDSLLFPNFPIKRELKTCNEEVYAAVISDIHIGSKNFLESAFVYFIDWLNKKVGSEKEKLVADKVKYVFIVGDLVSGIGVYPNQEQDLEIVDLKQQYEKLTEHLSKIRKDIKLIICPGNHDAVRMTEPQPPLVKEYAENLLNLKNAIFVSSPSLINIHSSANFEGFNFLMYHGSSFHYYNNSIMRLLTNDAKNNPTMTWKYLLQKRHLAPAHGSTVYVPDPNEDGLLIDVLPDVVINGDVHRSDLDNYQGILIISSSCWEKKSVIQERRGNEPDPGRVPFFNLKTRDVLFLDFWKK